MRVRTIEEHEANLAQIRETWVRRNEAQMEDAALSVWSDQCRADGERFAIDLLKNGIEQCGKEIPMAWFRFLLDADNNHVDAKEIVTKDGRVVWILGDAAEAKYGRKFIPVGKRSRIQKQFGLHEDWAWAEANRYIKGHCGWIGGIMTYRATRQQDCPLPNLKVKH